MRSEGDEYETSSVKIACSMVRFIKRYERIEIPLITHACVGQNVGIGTVHFQQAAQDEAKKR